MLIKTETGWRGPNEAERQIELDHQRGPTWGGNVPVMRRKRDDIICNLHNR